MTGHTPSDVTSPEQQPARGAPVRVRQVVAAPVHTPVEVVFTPSPLLATRGPEVVPGPEDREILLLSLLYSSPEVVRLLHHLPHRRDGLVQAVLILLPGDLQLVEMVSMGPGEL